MSVCALGFALTIGLHDASVGSAVLAVALFLASTAAGWTVDSRLRLGGLLQAQARELLLAADLATMNRAAEVRGRIAGDVQDVLSRRVQEMVAEAGAAQHLSATDPTDAGAAVAAVEASGRAALEEVRRMLGVLRQSGEPAPAAPAVARPWKPLTAGRFQPFVSRIDPWVRSTRGSATGSRECDTGRGPTAGNSSPGRDMVAASASAPPSPSHSCRRRNPHDDPAAATDPGAHRRRPGARPHRLPADPRHRGRHGCRRGGRRWPRGSAAGERAEARRRTPGHPDAWPGWT